MEYSYSYTHSIVRSWYLLTCRVKLDPSVMLFTPMTINLHITLDFYNTVSTIIFNSAVAMIHCIRRNITGNACSLDILASVYIYIMCIYSYTLYYLLFYVSIIMTWPITWISLSGITYFYHCRHKVSVKSKIALIAKYSGCL